MQPNSAATRDRVYARLRQQILGGRLAPGAPLVASQLVRDVQASRTPVREALRQLVSDGLVRETPAGLVVEELSEEDILDLYEVRIPLEAATARLAAMNMTPVALAQLEALHEKLAEEARHPQPDARWFATANLEFHRAVCEAGRNRLLREFMTRIYDTMGRFIHNSFRRPARVVEVVEEHARLVAALAARDAGAAEREARLHMERALEARLGLYRAQHRGSGRARTTDDGRGGRPARRGAARTRRR